MSGPWCFMRAGGAVALEAVPDLPLDALRAAVVAAVGAGRRLGCWCGDGAGRVYAVLVDDAAGQLLVARAPLPDSYPALTPDCPQAHLFERELAEQYGVVPVGHPWFKPVRFHRRLTPGPDAWGRPDDEAVLPGVADMFTVAGDEVHEVAVGPVHAGVIEPGHFRFQCHGEVVFHLEINLGYQHRGIERAAIGGPHPRSMLQMEAAAGDSTIAHGWAHCQVVEALAGVAAEQPALDLRALMLELERLANHTGDLGALAGDTGFLPTASFNGRIRGDFLNLSAAVCGSRLGRGMLRPGGVRFGLDAARREDMRRRLERAGADAVHSCRLLFATASVQARFEDVGVVRPIDAAAAGLVGVARRACGHPADARRDHPADGRPGPAGPAATAEGGDVHARAFVRFAELQESLRLADGLLQRDAAATPPGALRCRPRPGHLAIGLIEGWRGPVLHLGITGDDGRFLRYKVVDPSFHNWFGLMLALRDEQISDFPLCNKSFNLSYCGFDL
ncbi:MAG: hydrogenase [Planctomycetes bacterium]|nr:hydrogenase [Planctomycetota bacterium]